MSKTITATEARVNFGRVMRELVESNQPITVERAGKRQIVMLSAEQYDQLTTESTSKTNAYWKTRLAELHRRADEERAQLGGELPDPAEIINKMREDRTAELEESVGLR